MLKKLKIENFRRFRSLEFQNLGRLNLLVGLNNCGKTSVLEAIQLLCSGSDIDHLNDTMRNRGEYLWHRSKRQYELDIRHLFYGHEIQPKSQFSISATNDDTEEKMIAMVRFSQFESLDIPYSEIDESDKIFNGDSNNLSRLRFVLNWIYKEGQEGFERPLSENGGLSSEYTRRFRTNKDIKNSKNTQFINSSALTRSKMIELFDQIVLTPEEQLIYQSLQTIEPEIQRIATVSSGRYADMDERVGFVALLSDNHQRIPLGSMGDGIWRILGLALATVGSANGVLLVDEIDTGLHFTAMSDMWKLIWETAKRLNVQVFATTHSSDCWTSLASIASQEETQTDGITIQRIELNKDVAVAFDASEIIIAADRGIEVR